jgi:hypothetical protein
MCNPGVKQWQRCFSPSVGCENGASVLRNPSRRCDVPGACSIATNHARATHLSTCERFYPINSFDSRVIARRKRAVRSQHQGRAVCGQHPMRTTQVFFGDFLSPDKKLPAAKQRKLCLSKTQKFKGKKLDSRFRWNDTHFEHESQEISASLSSRSRKSTALRKCGITIDPPTTRPTLNTSKNSSRVTPASRHSATW